MPSKDHRGASPGADHGGTHHEVPDVLDRRRGRSAASGAGLLSVVTLFRGPRLLTIRALHPSSSHWF